MRDSLGPVVGWRLRAQAIAARVVGGSCAGGVGGAQNGETAHEGVVDGHQGARVVELTAVVGRTEHRHELAAAEEFIAILHDLMGSTDKVNVVFLEELLDDGLAECVRDASVVLSPTGLALFGV